MHAALSDWAPGREHIVPTGHEGHEWPTAVCPRTILTRTMPAVSLTRSRVDCSCACILGCSRRIRTRILGGVQPWGQVVDGNVPAGARPRLGARALQRGRGGQALSNKCGSRGNLNHLPAFRCHSSLPGGRPSAAPAAARRTTCARRASAALSHLQPSRAAPTPLANAAQECTIVYISIFTVATRWPLVLPLRPS